MASLFLASLATGTQEPEPEREREVLDNDCISFVEDMTKIEVPLIVIHEDDELEGCKMTSASTIDADLYGDLVYDNSDDDDDDAEPLPHHVHSPVPMQQVQLYQHPTCNLMPQEHVYRDNSQNCNNYGYSADHSPTTGGRVGRDDIEFNQHSIFSAATPHMHSLQDGPQSQMLQQQLPMTSSIPMLTSPRSSMPSLRIADLEQQGTISNSNNDIINNSVLWTAGSVNGVRLPGEKPKRPLSAYNFFFQLERERIVVRSESDDSEDSPIKPYTIEDVARVALVQQNKLKDSSPKEKRSHRKTHGKISFGDLARRIAQRWKQLDEESKRIFDGSAAIEKDRYRRELAEWTKHQKKWKDAAAKMATVLRHSDANPEALPSLTPQSIYETNDDQAVCTDLTYIGSSHGDDEVMIVTPTKSPKPTSSQQQYGSPSKGQKLVSTIFKQPSILKNGTVITPVRSSQQARYASEQSRRSSMQSSNNSQQVQQQSSRLNNGRRFSTGMVPAFHNSSGGGGRGLPFQHMEAFPNVNTNGSFDYDDLAAQTYNNAHQMLGQQSQNMMRPHNSSYHTMLQQRRTRMAAMMQHRQNEQLACMEQHLHPEQAMMHQQRKMMRMMMLMNKNHTYNMINPYEFNVVDEAGDLDLAFDDVDHSIHQQEQQYQVLLKQFSMTSCSEGSAMIHGNGNGMLDSTAEYDTGSAISWSTSQQQRQLSHFEGMLSTTDDVHAPNLTMHHSSEGFD